MVSSGFNHINFVSLEALQSNHTAINHSRHVNCGCFLFTGLIVFIMPSTLFQVVNLQLVKTIISNSTRILNNSNFFFKEINNN